MQPRLRASIVRDNPIKTKSQPGKTLRMPEAR